MFSSPALSVGDGLSLRELAVSGRDLLAIGYQPGPALGQALQALLDAVLDGSVENEKDALLRQALGDHVFNKLIEAKENEWNEYRQKVTQWELDEYLMRY